MTSDDRYIVKLHRHTSIERIAAVGAFIIESDIQDAFIEIEPFEWPGELFRRAWTPIGISLLNEHDAVAVSSVVSNVMADMPDSNEWVVSNCFTNCQCNCNDGL